MDAYPRRGGKRGIVRVQPLGEFADDAIAPHPGRESLELVECGVQRDGVAVAGVSIQLEGIGPIAFDRDGVEAVLLDQAARDLGAHRIELVRAVSRFSEEHEAAMRNAYYVK